MSEIECFKPNPPSSMGLFITKVYRGLLGWAPRDHVGYEDIPLDAEVVVVSHHSHGVYVNAAPVHGLEHVENLILR
jgi:hypothetical protein